MLGRDQLKCILSIFVNLALVLLPLYASDYPFTDKKNYNRLLVQWTKRSQSVIDHYISMFKGGEELAAATGRISMRQFIDSCKKHDIFNVLQIRDAAKHTQILENANPNINRESLLSTDLFGGRLS